LNIFLFIISFITLDIVGTVFYIGVLLLSFFVVGKAFKMRKNLLFEDYSRIGRTSKMYNHSYNRTF